AELLDAGFDLPGCLRHCHIDNDMTLRRGDQIGRKAVGADVVDVADDLERLGRLVPGSDRIFQQILQGLRLRATGEAELQSKNCEQQPHCILPFCFLGLTSYAVSASPSSCTTEWWTLDLDKIDRPTRAVVIEYADHQAPGAPGHRIEIGAPGEQLWT